MKRSFLSVIFLLAVFINQGFAQTDLPTFLQGTWKMESREVYENWKIHDNGNMNGTSYKIVNGEENITEYLEISIQGEEIIYTATVPTQNEGKGIEFVLHQPDSITYSFENPEHDFPKKIVYQKRSDSEIFVMVSDGGDQGFSYIMQKVNVKAPNLLTSFFGDISGVWIASPADSSFISRLEYKKGSEQFLIPVGNTLTSKTGELFAEYEGVYIYNPVEKNISFTTVTGHEIHTGVSWVKGDTLFHQGKIEGPGNIKSYSSAIIKKTDKTLHYFADYSELDEFPELKFSQALIYRKEQAHN